MTMYGHGMIRNDDEDDNEDDLKLLKARLGLDVQLLLDFISH